MSVLKCIQAWECVAWRKDSVCRRLLMSSGGNKSPTHIIIYMYYWCWANMPCTKISLTALNVFRATNLPFTVKCRYNAVEYTTISNKTMQLWRSYGKEDWRLLLCKTMVLWSGSRVFVRRTHNPIMGANRGELIDNYPSCIFHTVELGYRGSNGW